MKKSRDYLFDRTEEDEHGCDSIIYLSLLVTPPSFDQLDTVILSIDTFYWYGTRRDTTGQHLKYHTLAGGCDSVSILNLTVLNVKITNDTICDGETAELTIEVSSDAGYAFARPNIGDVLCKDGSILRPDSFIRLIHPDPDPNAANLPLAEGKEPIGVVFYIDPNDPTHMTGRAISLFDAYSTYLAWARPGMDTSVHSYHYYYNSKHLAAMRDMEGYRNTQRIKQTAEGAAGGSFKENAPAAYYCWYYDPDNPNWYSNPNTGPEHKNWYLPSLGELNIAFSYRAVINHTLLLLQPYGYASAFTDGNGADSKYWTSTESIVNKNPNQAYCISSLGQLNNRNGKTINTNNPKYIRAVIAFPLKPY